MKSHEKASNNVLNLAPFLSDPSDDNHLVNVTGASIRPELHAINAIGNKFAAPGVETTGPQSAPPLATGLYTGEVDFYFGVLPGTK